MERLDQERAPRRDATEYTGTIVSPSGFLPDIEVNRGAVYPSIAVDLPAGPILFAREPHLPRQGLAGSQLDQMPERGITLPELISAKRHGFLRELIDVMHIPGSAYVSNCENERSTVAVAFKHPAPPFRDFMEAQPKIAATAVSGHVKPLDASVICNEASNFDIGCA
jgi:hypothetical protein